ncbi:MAG: N-acetyltransferase [Flavobacterium sp.]|nr:N-acetyltransferase [Flavobacterium sp.]
MDHKTSIAIKDNTFARQFETTIEQGLITVEYSFQERKIFLTKIQIPEGFTDEEFISNLLKNIMEIAYERKLKVVPIFPKIALFFRKNTQYRDLLPPGIKI